MGTYTDDVYKEQSKIYEDRITSAELVLGKTIYDKYNIGDVEKFMKEKFSDLGKTYVESEPGERRVLLGSICPAGLAWRYSGLSNQQFSPQYQAILSVRDTDLALSTPDLFSFELFLPWIDKIMKVYPDNQENSNDFINQTGHSDEYYKRKIN
jgi:hypothetical protein